jgi:uncharacterized protein YgiM (DUF1202 family)
MRLALTVCCMLGLMGTLIAIASENNLDSFQFNQFSENQICAESVEQFYTIATDVCIGAPSGYICNGGSAPQVLPEGHIAHALNPLGALVPPTQIDSLRNMRFDANGTSGGLIWMRLSDLNTNMLLLGDVHLTNRIEAGTEFPKWMSFTIETGDDLATCGALPPNSLIVQNADRMVTSRIVVNGASLDVNGTVMIYTVGEQTVFVSLEGILRVLAHRQPQTLLAGQETRITYQAGDWTTPFSAPAIPIPHTLGALNIPIELFDRPISLPQPGYVTTEATVNLRTGPSTNHALLYQVPAGQNMTILGKNSAGDWYHVRLANGQTGWIFAELLRRNHGVIAQVYEQTPIPPQRYGTAGTQATVTGQGVMLRSAPHAGFPAIFTVADGTPLQLIARSPYSPWVKVDSQGSVGWIPLLNLETQAIIDSLPIERNVPLPPTPPEPTAIPGLTGFAFPDPSCFPDC